MTTPDRHENPHCQWADPPCTEDGLLLVGPEKSWGPHARKLYCLRHLGVAAQEFPGIEADLYATQEHCDFCDGPGPYWMLTADAITTVIMRPDGNEEHNMDEEWAVCAECKPYVETLDPGVVADHVLEKWGDNPIDRSALIATYRPLFASAKLPLQKEPI